MSLTVPQQVPSLLVVLQQEKKAFSLAAALIDWMLEEDEEEEEEREIRTKLYKIPWSSMEIMRSKYRPSNQ